MVIMQKLLIRMPSNNNNTVVVLETLTQGSEVSFYWRKINECRTRFVVTWNIEQLNSSMLQYGTAMVSIYKEVARLCDGEFMGVLNP